VGQDASIRNIVAQYSMGFVSATASPAQIVINYYTQAAPNTVVTGTGSNAPGNIVEVRIQNYSFQWLVPLGASTTAPSRSATPLSINVSSFDVMGGLPFNSGGVTR
jgi:hypothetical protein